MIKIMETQYEIDYNRIAQAIHFLKLNYKKQPTLEEAARELNAFRDAYPDADARLPASLVGWAANVRHNVR